MGLTVLITDDCRDTSASLTLLVELWGHRAHVANDGASALRLAAKVAPDVLLLDVAMPRLNGWEVAARARELPGLRDMLIIAITGFGRDQDHCSSQNAGVDHHLTKPIDPDELERLLASHAAWGKPAPSSRTPVTGAGDRTP